MSTETRMQRSVEFVQKWVDSLPSTDHLDDGRDDNPPSPSSSSSGQQSSLSHSNTDPYSHTEERFHIPLRHRLNAEVAVAAAADLHRSSTAQLIRPGNNFISGSPDLTTSTESAYQTSTAQITNSSPNTRRRAFSQKDTRLTWMHSNYSSFTSETSSIDQLLEDRKANPEEVLMNLGFGDIDKSVGARLPARFLASQTQATGINMQHFIMSHPELVRYYNSESKLAMGALYSRLPAHYRKSEGAGSHTSLHKSFSISSQEFAMDHNTVPITVHQGEDGHMYTSILSKSNADELARQGFYADHAAPRHHQSLEKLSSSSSISTHDCTIDSVDTPSPILLNNSPTDSMHQNPFTIPKSNSQGSDSVFSSTESYNMDQRLRAKLEAIQEKTLNELSEEDLEDGISFVNIRRRSDSEVVHKRKSADEQLSSDMLPIIEDQDKSIHAKRQAFARLKSRSYGEERINRVLQSAAIPAIHQPHEQGMHHPSLRQGAETSTPINHPIIVTTTHDQSESTAEEKRRVIPKQIEGLLQVINPESFDSIDSDTGTLVPSASTSPCQGMSPSTSRHNSLGVIPAMESFELEEVQSGCEQLSSPGEAAAPLPTSKRRRAKLQRSVSERSDSDSSGIADIDGKSSTGRRTGNNSPKNRSPNSPNTNNNSLTVTCDASLAPGRPHSISSSNQTLNSVHSTISAQTAQTVVLQIPSASVRLRRSSESDLQYYSANSSPSSHYFTHTYNFDASPKIQDSVETVDAEIQTEEMLCPCCRASLIYCNVRRPSSTDDWMINNDMVNKTPLLSSDSDDIYNIPRNHRDTHLRTRESVSGGDKVNFYISTESEAEGTSMSSSLPASPQHDLYHLPTSNKTPSTVDEVCSEMTQDLQLLQTLFEKYNIQKPQSPLPESEAGMKEQILSSLQVAAAVLQTKTPTPVHNMHHHTIGAHSHRISSLSEKDTQFLPITVDFPRQTATLTARTPVKQCQATAPSTDRLVYSMDAHRGSGHIPLSEHSSTHASLQSLPNSNTASSVTSSISRLSEQLRHADTKARYELA